MNKQLTKTEIDTIVKLMAEMATSQEINYIAGNLEAAENRKARRQQLNDILFGLTTKTLADYYAENHNLYNFELERVGA